MLLHASKPPASHEEEEGRICYRHTHLLVLAVLLGFCSSSGFTQSVPQLINYRGQITQSDGSPPATADYELQFSIYDAPTGGHHLWGPQIFNGQSGPGYGSKVPVVAGDFSVVLGPLDTNSVPIEAVFRQTNCYLEISVGGHAPVLPRQSLTSTPYVFRALSSASAANAAKMAGCDWSALLGTNDPVRGRLNGARILPQSISTLQLSSNAITSNHIAPGAITPDLLAPGVVGSMELASNAILGSQIAEFSITSNHIAPGQIVQRLLAPTSVTTSNLVDGCVTLQKLGERLLQSGASAPGNIAVSQPCGDDGYSISNLTVTIQTTGRPVLLALIGEVRNTVYSSCDINVGNNWAAYGYFGFSRGTLKLCRYLLSADNSSNSYRSVPCSGFQMIDVPPAPGTYTYSFWVEQGHQAKVYASKLVAYEL